MAPAENTIFSLFLLICLLGLNLYLDRRRQPGRTPGLVAEPARPQLTSGQFAFGPKPVLPR